MAFSSYLPSSQFALIVSSVLLSGGLVVAAQYVTKSSPLDSSLVTTSASPYGNVDWQKTLTAIQAQNPLGNLPPEPNPDAVENLLAAAQSPNITNTVARTLFISLSDAKAQGLGSDVPTQEILIAQANAEIAKIQPGVEYKKEDLEQVPVTNASLKTYGNAVMSILIQHPKASYIDTLSTLSYIIDNNDISKTSQLTTIGTEYEALSQELLDLPVPQTLVPLHLSIVNNFAQVAQSYEDMALLSPDPLRALAALERYQTLIAEINRVFTNVAQELAKNSILFSKDEPGETWTLLLLQ